MWFVLGFTLLLVVLWGIAMKLFPHTITLKEGLVVLVIEVAVIGFTILGSLYGAGADTAILNGEVTNKKREKVSCEHSYSCNCRTSCSGSGSSQSCSTICDTCYEHSYDVDWNVYSNVGSLSIDRVNRQGTQEPPRWTAVKKGEPFSNESSYYNYIKASPFSIFNRQQIESNVPVPSYIGVHDYYRINRVINFGSRYKPDNTLNTLLNESLKVLGPKKHVNVVVVLHSKGSAFPEVLKAKHLGGKINDVYVVLDMAPDGTYNHVDVFSWSKNSLVNVLIRDGILDTNKYDAHLINQIIYANIDKHYVKRSIKEYEYLEDEVEIPKGVVWFVMFFGMVFPFVGAFVAHIHDIV